MEGGSTEMEVEGPQAVSEFTDREQTVSAGVVGLVFGSMILSPLAGLAIGAGMAYTVKKDNRFGQCSRKAANWGLHTKKKVTKITSKNCPCRKNQANAHPDSIATPVEAMPLRDEEEVSMAAPLVVASSEDQCESADQNV
mmetsp:Transcript_121779/g.191144  ORF Transcript_121779/g.191144 Transcript_121779/m.191144 type:complete len:140 (-) Transcript_121779:92-511(-)